MSKYDEVLGEKPPPKDKPPGLFNKFCKLLLPRKFHRYLTPEAFVAWNISSYVTLVQVFIIQNWKILSKWFTEVAMPTTVTMYRAMKDVVSDIAGMSF